MVFIDIIDTNHFHLSILGRVADSKKPGDINVVTPRAVRKTNLTETSFACLPQSSKELEVSVLEEL